MTARNNSVSIRTQNITHVIVDANALAPLRLKYPDGLIMTALPSNRALIVQAARETKTAILIRTAKTQHGERLQVYATTDGVKACAVTVDPVEFFKAFRRLQVDAWTGK